MEYKLADFNLAAFDPDGLQKGIAGTPLYASPEMLAGKTYSTGHDIWTLGVTIFQMAALETPWNATSTN
jgi:serine/threonine protein kinase